MTDEQAIQTTISTYSESASHLDLTRLLSTFMPDATWDFSGTEHCYRGLEQMLEGFGRLSEPLEFLLQMNAPAIISVDGDRATARSVIQESGKLKGRDDYIQILGIYDDRLIRSPEGWRFTYRTFTQTELTAPGRILAMKAGAKPVDTSTLTGRF